MRLKEVLMQMGYDEDQANQEIEDGKEYLHELFGEGREIEAFDVCSEIVGIMKLKTFKNIKFGGIMQTQTPVIKKDVTNINVTFSIKVNDDIELTKSVFFCTSVDMKKDCEEAIERLKKGYDNYVIARDFEV